MSAVASLVYIRCNSNKSVLKFSDFIPKDLAITGAKKFLWNLAIQAPRIVVN